MVIILKMVELILPKDNREGKIRGRKPKKFAELMLNNAFKQFGLDVYKKIKSDNWNEDFTDEINKLENTLKELNIDLKEWGMINGKGKFN